MGAGRATTRDLCSRLSLLPPTRTRTAPATDGRLRILRFVLKVKVKTVPWGSMRFVRVCACVRWGLVFAATRPAVPQTLADSPAWFVGTDLIINNNSTWLGEDVPCVAYGTRGRMRVEVTGVRVSPPPESTGGADAALVGIAQCGARRPTCTVEPMVAASERRWQISLQFRRLSQRYVVTRACAHSDF